MIRDPVGFMKRMAKHLLECKPGREAQTMRMVALHLSSYAEALNAEAIARIETSIMDAHVKEMRKSLSSKDLILEGIILSPQIGDPRIATIPPRTELGNCMDCGQAVWIVEIDDDIREKYNPKPVCPACIRQRFPGIVLLGGDVEPRG